MPFAGFKNFDECLKKIKEKNPDYDDETARNVCGKLQAEHEGTAKADAASVSPETVDVDPEKGKMQIKKSWEHTLPNILGSPRLAQMTFHVPKVDKDNEIISASAMAAALEDYMNFPIISEFHKERPVGIAQKVWQTGDDEFKALIRFRDDPSVDDVWNKVQRGEYNAVSIAGKRIVYSPECNLHPAMRKADQPCRTEALRLDSVSVCDERARNDGTSLHVVKASSDDPTAFTYTTALEITQVEDTLIKAETSNSPLIHPVTDGTKRTACKCRKGDSMPDTPEEPPVKKSDGEEKKTDEEKKERSEEEKKGEAGTPEKQAMEKAEDESEEKKLLKAVLAKLDQLVESDKKVHASIGKSEESEEKEEEEEEKCKKAVKKATPPTPPAQPATESPEIQKAQMEQDIKKAIDTALAPVLQQIADLTAKVEAYGDQPITKAGIVITQLEVDHEGKPVLGNAGALAEVHKRAKAGGK